MRGRVSNRGALGTVRFDDARGLGVEAARSEGVLGETRANGALYVALDPGADSPVVALAPRAPDAPPDAMMLVSSTREVRDLRRDARGVRFTVEAGAEMVWRGPGACAARATLRAADGRIVLRRSVGPGPDGALRIAAQPTPGALRYAATLDAACAR
jgi:hypothetical protein